MRVDWTISALAHAGLVAWGLLTFGPKPFEAMPESVPVDIISEKQFSEVTAGSKTAPKAETPKPLVEKVGETRPVEDAKPKVSEKPEIKAAKAEQPPAPVPEPRPTPPKPKISQPKADPIAEALKKDAAAKRREEIREKPKKVEEKEQVKRDQPRFDPSKVAALLDKRDPQRLAATGAALNNTASLGLPSANAARLSQSEIDALRARLAQLWNPPVGARSPDELVVLIRVQFTRDGRLARPPQVLTSGHSVLFQTARESAIRALYLGQPFDMLRPEHYEQWKDIEINFDPRDMMRG
jgi:colicin import membrane protein